MTEQEKSLTEAIRHGDNEAVGKLADLMRDTKRDFVEYRIRGGMEKYADKKLRDYVLLYVLNVCPHCGSDHTSVKNYNMMWHDGDITCDDCGGYVRMYDAG